MTLVITFEVVVVVVGVDGGAVVVVVVVVVGIFTQSVQGLPLHLYPLSQSHTASEILEQFFLYTMSTVKAAYSTH